MVTITMERLSDDAETIQRLLPWIGNIEDIVSFLRKIPIDHSHLRIPLTVSYFFELRDKSEQNSEQKIENDAREIVILLPDIPYNLIKSRLRSLGNIPNRKEVVVRQLLNERLELKWILHEIDHSSSKKRCNEEDLSLDELQDNETNIKIKIRKVDGSLEVISSIKQEVLTSPKLLNVKPEIFKQRATEGDSASISSTSVTPDLLITNSSQSKSADFTVTTSYSESNIQQPSTTNVIKGKMKRNVSYDVPDMFNLIEYLKDVTHCSGGKIKRICKRFRVPTNKRPNEMILNELLNNLFDDNIIELRDSDTDSSSDVILDLSNSVETDDVNAKEQTQVFSSKPILKPATLVIGGNSNAPKINCKKSNIIKPARLRHVTLPQDIPFGEPLEPFEDESYLYPSKESDDLEMLPASSTTKHDNFDNCFINNYPHSPHYGSECNINNYPDDSRHYGSEYNGDNNAEYRQINDPSPEASTNSSDVLVKKEKNSPEMPESSNEGLNPDASNNGNWIDDMINFGWSDRLRNKERETVIKEEPSTSTFKVEATGSDDQLNPVFQAREFPDGSRDDPPAIFNEPDRNKSFLWRPHLPQEEAASGSKMQEERPEPFQIKEEPIIPQIKEERAVELPQIKEEPVIELPQIQEEPAIELPQIQEEPAVQLPQIEEEAATNNQKLVLRMMEIFPDASPTFIKKLCRNKDFVDVDNMVTEVLSLESYPRREQRPPSPPKEYDIEEQLEIVKALLPDADPTYLRWQCEKFGKNTEQLNVFINEARENKNYPTMKEYLRKQKLSAQSKQYTSEFSVEKFVELFPDPEKTFRDPTRKFTVDNYTQLYISNFFQNRYDKLAVKNIRSILSNKNNNILSSDDEMKDFIKRGVIMKSRRRNVMLQDPPQNIAILQELAYLVHKEEIDNYIKEREQAEEEEKKIAKENNLLNTCQCCYDDEVMPKDTFCCPIGCSFCRSCIQKSCEVAMGDGKTDFKCLNDCSDEFTLQTLQKVLPPKLFSKLAQKKALAEVKAAGIEELESCPFCDFASIPNPTDKVFRCLNPDCMKESCRLCKEENHIPYKCDEVEKDADVKARVFVENQMTEALLRKCWKCSKSFFKEEGCNKMTCTCGAKMCYICNQPVKDYTHFNGLGGDKYQLCPLYTDTNAFNQKNVIKAAELAKTKVDPSKLKIDPTLDIKEHFEQRKGKLPPEPHIRILQDMRMQGAQMMQGHGRAHVIHPPVGLAEAAQARPDVVNDLRDGNVARHLGDVLEALLEIRRNNQLVRHHIPRRVHRARPPPAHRQNPTHQAPPRAHRPQSPDEAPHRR